MSIGWWFVAVVVGVFVIVLIAALVWYITSATDEFDK